jgi:23S rRNA (cytosine1962-C5)-methyltransferase
MKYSLLDSGNFMKLEQLGRIRLVRPALNAFWEPSLPQAEWSRADGVFTRNSSGGGDWKWKKGKEPKPWDILWGGLTLRVKPTGFGHIGFFAEQYENWSWLRQSVKKIDSPVSTLNLFAYSGGSSLAMASVGAAVCHLDSAKGMIEWGKENLELNKDIPPKIRWITDDVKKFVAREIRRGQKYNGIVLDPPSFGRGAQGQIWKIEEGIVELLKSCRELVDLSKSFFILFSCHSQGFTPVSMSRVLEDIFPEGKEKECGEMLVPEKSGKALSAGAYARIFAPAKQV